MRVIDVLYPFFQLDLYYYVVSMHFTGAPCLILPSVAMQHIPKALLCVNHSRA